MDIWIAAFVIVETLSYCNSELLFLKLILKEFSLHSIKHMIQLNLFHTSNKIYVLMVIIIHSHNHTLSC